MFYRQFGSSGEDYAKSVTAGSDGSIVVVGYTEGDMGGTNAGEADFAVMKLDASGTLLWIWQVLDKTSTKKLLIICKHYSTSSINNSSENPQLYTLFLAVNNNSNN